MDFPITVLIPQEPNVTVESASVMHPDLNDAHQKRLTAFFVVLGIIIPIGVFFNMLMFVVLLLSPSLRRTTTARYLIALALADTTYLLGEFMTWLNTEDTEKLILGLEFTQTNSFFCASQYFLRYYGKFASVWLTVAITMERYIVVTFPLRVNRISTKLTTTLVIVSIYAVGFILTVFPYWTTDVVWDNQFGYHYCTYKRQRENTIWNWVVIKVLSLFLPCGLILLFTGLLIYQLRKLRTERRKIMRDENDIVIENQLTLMLICVAVTTLILRLPYTIIYQPFDYRYQIWGYEIEYSWLEFRLHVARDISYLISTTNYAINFFLFCLTGSIFRRNLRLCMHCKSIERNKRTRGQYTRTTLATSVKHSSNTNVSTNRMNLNSSNISLQRITPQPSPSQAKRDTTVEVCGYS